MKRIWLALLVCFAMVAALGAAETQAQLQKEAKVSKARAEHIALSRVHQGKIASSELEREHGHLIWSFDIRSSTGITEVNVDAIDGNVIEARHESASAERAEKKNEQTEMQREAKISMTEARRIALREVPHGSIRSQELERENGHLIYSFDILRGKATTEVNVDAKNGNVIAVQHESKSAEAAEKRAAAKRH
ncbi:MAG TPA: PepSY domain-containing protein [Thermoanaerobaculia bacterium]|jgi:uncharacterized membrane protein YkoI|nr:PepSY domain-containing protein [Thermoanaerobaculia bacterium]